MFKPADLFDLSQTEHAALFADCAFAWEALNRIKGYLAGQVQPNPDRFRNAGIYIGDHVQIGEGTVIEWGAMIKGPAIVGRNCEIRHGAYIRENTILGDHCVVGNSSEIKNSLLFNRALVPHFNYVGDSILGYQAHLGAGVKISNFKLVPGNIAVEFEGRCFDTGLRKFGALIGDKSDVGCNAVLNPGSVIGPGCIIYANTNWRGVLPPYRIVKNKAGQEVVNRLFRDSG